MELTLRAATPAECLYAAAQSAQIAGQCGSAGYIHGKIADNSIVFAGEWERAIPEWNTVEFKEEFGTVLVKLPKGTAMTDFCKTQPDAKTDKDYVFRADTDKYSYLIRCGSDNKVGIYPYQRKWLDIHMSHAEKGIRFIDPHYHEKFRVSDGDTVRIITGYGEKLDRKVRYIDDTHLELGNSLYHICELAEKLERSGGTVMPLSDTPEHKRSDKQRVSTRGDAR